MITTTRILLIAIFLTLALNTVNLMYTNDFTDAEFGFITDFSNSIDTESNTISSDEGLTGTTKTDSSAQYEVSLLDSVLWGFTIVKVGFTLFFKSFFPIPTTLAENTLEVTIVHMINLFRASLLFIIIIEIIMLIKNRSR